MKILLLILVIILSQSCFFDTRPRDVQLVCKITKKTASKLKEEKDLQFIGRGSQMMNKIEMLAMSFVYRHEIDIDVGRDLLVTAVREYLGAVNSNEEIRPYLANYPFEPKNVEIRIFIHEPNGYKVPEGKISVISAINGILKYDADEGDGYKRIHRETYEEALERLGKAAA